MNEERLAEIEENAKWIRFDAAQQGEEREYVLAVDACELIAEVRSLRAKLDAVPVESIRYCWQPNRDDDDWSLHSDNVENWFRRQP